MKSTPRARSVCLQYIHDAATDMIQAASLYSKYNHPSHTGSVDPPAETDFLSKVSLFSIYKRRDY
jgi:hypothetical protein